MFQDISATDWIGIYGAVLATIVAGIQLWLLWGQRRKIDIYCSEVYFEGKYPKSDPRSVLPHAISIKVVNTGGRPVQIGDLLLRLKDDTELSLNHLAKINTSTGHLLDPSFPIRLEYSDSVELRLDTLELANDLIQDNIRYEKPIIPVGFSIEDTVGKPDKARLSKRIKVMLGELELYGNPSSNLTPQGS